MTAGMSGIRVFCFIEPCIPTAARVPPSGLGWLHEIKHDGYRLVTRLEGSRARLFSRRGFPRIGEALASLRARSMTIDGEAVVLCAKAGHSLFDELHSGRRDRDAILYAFDLIELSGKDERSLGSNFSLKKTAELSPAGPISEARGRPEAALGGGDVTRVKIKPPSWVGVGLAILTQNAAAHRSAPCRPDRWQ